MAKIGRKSGYTVYAVWKKDDYIGEGSLQKIAELTGMRPKYIQELASPSHQKVNKTWTVEILIRDEDTFASFDEVDYDKLNEVMKQTNTRPKHLAEVLKINYYTAADKVAKRIRFRYTEIEELEDLFFLEEGELIVD